MLNPFVDRVFKFRYIMENASSDALARDLGEEPLDEVEPGAGCGVKWSVKRLCLASQRAEAGFKCL
jgi:hypothetical protein